MNTLYRRLLLLAALLALLAFTVPAAGQDAVWPRTLADGLGNEIVIAAPPQRIVSVSLGVDETLLPLIGPERFAAVTGLALDPAISNVALLAAQVPATIAAATDIERIIALEPDLVFVASFTQPEIVQQLRDAGLTVFAAGYPVGLETVRANIALLGRAVGAEDAAAAALAALDTGLLAVASAVGAPEVPVRALWLTPGNYTSGADSTISDVIAAAGGVDVAAAAGASQFAPLTDEFIVEQDPDVILLSGWTPWDPSFQDAFRDNPAFAGLSAVRNGRVYIANDAHLTTTSQFIAEGVKDVAAYLYPDLYPVFPVTVTDAAGSAISIPARPETVMYTFEPGAALRALFDTLEGVAVMPATARIALDAVDVVFYAADDPDAVPAGLPASAAAIALHAGDTPAAALADLLLAGAALGERVAALQAVARFSDLAEVGAN